jgi:pimeloyl-ACP methyl ester carboxylesterase
MRQWLRNGMAGGGDVLISDCEKMVGPLSDGLASRLRAADLEAYLAAAHDRIAIDDVLETMAMPSCLYAGEADPIFMEAKLASERISDARFFAIPELAHLPAFVTSSSVLPSVMAFLHYVH